MVKMKRGDEVTVVETWPGVRRKTLALGEKTLLLEVTIKAGTIVNAHSHPSEQIGYIVTGRLRLRIGDDVYELKSGDAYVIQSNIVHEAQALEDTKVVEVFSPPHEVFKKDLEGD